MRVRNHRIEIGDARLGVGAARAVNRRVEQQVRHRVGRVRAQRARRRMVGQEQHAIRLAIERVDQRTDHVAVPTLERGHLLPDLALVAGFVGGLDVQEKEVAVTERREARLGWAP